MLTDIGLVLLQGEKNSVVATKQESTQQGFLAVYIYDVDEFRIEMYSVIVSILIACVGCRFR